MEWKKNVQARARRKNEEGEMWSWYKNDDDILLLFIFKMFYDSLGFRRLYVILL